MTVHNPADSTRLSAFVLRGSVIQKKTGRNSVSTAEPALTVNTYSGGANG